MNKDSVTYLQGFNTGVSTSKDRVIELDEQIRELKRLVNCKHMRVGSIRLLDGYSCKCLTCGYEWEEKDKPLSEFEKFMKAGMLRENEKKGVRNE